MSEERIFPIPESLLVGILNYLASHEAVRLFSTIQAAIQKGQEKEKEKKKKQGGKEK